MAKNSPAARTQAAINLINAAQTTRQIWSTPAERAAERVMEATRIGERFWAGRECPHMAELMPTVRDYVAQALGAGDPRAALGRLMAQGGVPAERAFGDILDLPRG